MLSLSPYYLRAAPNPQYYPHMAKFPAATPKKSRANSSILNEREQNFVDNIMAGMPPTTAAMASGTTPGYTQNVPKIQAEIARARAEVQDATLLKRLDTINGILEAINMAKLISDPTAMIRGWVEIGKILGHYAPEVREIRITGDQQRVKNQLEGLTDEELFAIANNNVVVLDAEYTDVTNSTKTNLSVLAETAH